MADISQFVGSYAPVAQKVGAALGVDPNILLGQWGLETGWGKHVVPGTHNLGNIKGPGVAATDNQNGSNDQYKSYASPDQFGGDFARLVATNYPDAAGAGDDAMAYAMAMKNGGYAEDPHYVNKLTSAVDTVRQNGGVIDPSKVQWDDGSTGGGAAGGIDASQVKWDDATPATPSAPVAKAAATPAPAAPAKKMTAREKISDAINNTWLDQLTGGITHGVTNTVGGVLQHAGHGLGYLAEKGGAPDLGAALTGAGDTAAQFLTQGTPNTPAGIAGQVIGGAALPGMNAGPTNIVANALKAGALGAAQPVQPGQDFGSETAKNALFGAGAGAAGTVAGRLIGGAATPEARALMDQGVTLTPGQAMGGLARSAEEKIKSVPVLGEAIGSAERASVRQFNTAMYRDALAPIGARLPRGVEAGSDGVEAVRGIIGNEFNQLSRNARFTPSAPLFARDLNAIRTDLAQRSPASLGQFDNVVDNQIMQRAPLQGGSPAIPPSPVLGANGLPIRPGVPAVPPVPGPLTGSQWNDARSYIAGLSRDNRLGQTNPDNRALADALDDLNEAMNNQVARQSTDPAFQQKLQNANNAYARYKRVETAAGMAGASNNGNVFTGAQYANAVRKGSTNFQRATNSGLNADVAQRAQSVLGNKYPDSGTPGRLLATALLGGAAHINPLSLAGAGAGSLLYATPAGRSAMLALLARRPELLQNLGDRTAQLAPLTGLLAPQGQALQSQLQGQ